MKEKRRIYLSNTPLQEALEKWLHFIFTILPKEREILAIHKSLGRITIEAVYAKLSSPLFNSSAMDGYAVHFHETFGASETNPLRLKFNKQAMPVNTGEPLPKGFNAVIMVEDVNVTSKYIEINESVTPYQHVRVIGEDIVQTELILPENHRIRPVDIGAMIASGNVEVAVRKRPFVTIIPTGNEVVAPKAELKVGNIIDSNSYMVGSLIQLWGGEYRREEAVPDNKELLKEKISASMKGSDFVVVIAGSSAGAKDFSPNAIEELGNVIVHGINIKPGRPILLGEISGKPVIGLPGYPVSTYITFELFGKPLIYHLEGMKPEQPEQLKAILSRPVASSLGHEEFLRVKVGKVGKRYIATPVGRGAGAIMTLQRADGIIQIPAMSEGLAPETEVKVSVIRPLEDISNTIVCIGSHDNTLDLLGNHLKRRFTSFSLSSAHVGSMGGLIALKRGEAHVAGTHLLDELTGEYNIPLIKRLLNGISLKVITLVYRQQGLIVKKGNPAKIQGIEDLTRNDIVFVNRQRGSGTRLLTDKCLRERGIAPQMIEGYEKEEYTHMGVASAVFARMADAGMGILTAAIALGLEFIPIAKERYDLVIGMTHFEAPMIQALLDIITSDQEFRGSVLALGGYDISDMGKIIYEQNGG